MAMKFYLAIVLLAGAAMAGSIDGPQPNGRHGESSEERHPPKPAPTTKAPTTKAPTTKAPQPPAPAEQPCSCSQRGNTYKPVDDCRAFTQETATLPPVRQNCPAGLQFNTKVCVCDWPRNVKCNTRCQAPAPPAPAPCSQSCTENGNTYRPLPGCGKFTQSVGGVVKGTHSCPTGLIFDTSVCVCNWPQKVSCGC